MGGKPRSLDRSGAGGPRRAGWGGGRLGRTTQPSGVSGEKRVSQRGRTLEGGGERAGERCCRERPWRGGQTALRGRWRSHLWGRVFLEIDDPITRFLQEPGGIRAEWRMWLWIGTLWGRPAAVREHRVGPAEEAGCRKTGVTEGKDAMAVPIGGTHRQPSIRRVRARGREMTVREACRVRVLTGPRLGTWNVGVGGARRTQDGEGGCAHRTHRVGGCTGGS
jgi:hypothetical protein